MFCFFQNNEIVLSEEHVRVIKQSKGVDIPFKVHTMGIYLVIEAKNGLVLIWDKKTTVMIKLKPTFKVGEGIYRRQVNINKVAILQIISIFFHPGKNMWSLW